jgi:hypothetical protein
MADKKDNYISASAGEIFHRLFSSLSDEHAALVDTIRDEILSTIPQYAGMADFRAPVKKIDALFLKKTNGRSRNEQNALKRALVATLALHLPVIISKMNLPDSILALYPDVFERLAVFLENHTVDPYDWTGELFCKDMRFVLGLSVPCGVLIIDMISRIPLPSVILSFFRSRNFKGVLRYTLARGTGKWFRGHLDSRYVADFNEREFDKFYIRVADLLEKRKDVSGYVGTSWLYDPQLLEISPHLAFFQERPLERGAFMLKHGTQQSDVINALKASKKRQRLYQEGKYITVCYSSLWPRRELISWARQARTSTSHD